jgi:hypothetical protein
MTWCSGWRTCWIANVGPALADLPDQKLWKTRRDADYGALNSVVVAWLHGATLVTVRTRLRSPDGDRIPAAPTCNRYVTDPQRSSPLLCALGVGRVRGLAAGDLLLARVLARPSGSGQPVQVLAGFGSFNAGGGNGADARRGAV